MEGRKGRGWVGWGGMERKWTRESSVCMDSFCLTCRFEVPQKGRAWEPLLFGLAGGRAHWTSSSCQSSSSSGSCSCSSTGCSLRSFHSFINYISSSRFCLSQCINLLFFFFFFVVLLVLVHNFLSLVCRSAFLCFLVLFMFLFVSVCSSWVLSDYLISSHPFVSFFILLVYLRTLFSILPYFYLLACSCSSHSSVCSSAFLPFPSLVQNRYRIAYSTGIFFRT